MKKNNFEKEGVSVEYLKKDEIANESQENQVIDKKHIASGSKQSKKLFEIEDRNNFLYSCYYCEYQTNSQHEYDHHVVIRHRGKPGYPGEADLEKYSLDAEKGHQFKD